MSDSLAPREIVARLIPVNIPLIAALFPAVFAGNIAMAQVQVDETVMPTPMIGATSPLGITMGSASSPTGIPLGATEITSAGVSPAPTGLAGTITIPTTSSGTACSTVATSASEMYGSAAMYDGGGTAPGATAPAAAVDPGTIPIPGASTSSGSGTSMSSGMMDTSGMSGMCGSGSSSIVSSSAPTSTSPTVPGGAARTGLPFGSYEIGNLGVSSTPAVPLPSPLPIASTLALGSSTSMMPSVAPVTGSATTLPPIGSTAACVPGATTITTARVAGAGSAGIRGSTIPEIMQRQFILCERTQ
jgi:hypothetical protein